MKTIVITLAVLFVLAACGDNGETPTADDTVEAATPTPTAAAADAPQESGGQGIQAAVAAMAADEPDLDSYLEFLDDVCRDPDEAEETWGGMAGYLDDAIDKLEGRRPPEELRAYVQATVGLMQATLEYAEEQDPGTRLHDGTEFQEFMQSPDVSAAMTALTSEQAALDPILAHRVQATGC